MIRIVTLSALVLLLLTGCSMGASVG